MILFLGAGASRAFEIPTTKEFITVFEEEIKNEDSMEDFYNKIKIKYTEEFDLEILLTVLDDLRKDEINLLRTISPYTTQLLLNNPKLLESENRKEIAGKLFLRVKETIVKKCMAPVENLMEKIIKTYDVFFNDLIVSMRGIISSYQSGDKEASYPGNLKIFTTNYDTCIEAYLNKRRIEFDKGLASRHGNQIFDINSYGNYDVRIGLFKLHGSIDLFRTLDGNMIYHPPSVGKTTMLGERIGEEVMMYPVESSGYTMSSQSPFLDLFRIFRDMISRDNIWIIVGFSFRDKTIASIFNDVLRVRDREEIKVIFIDPRSNEIKESLKEKGFPILAEKINIIENGFEMSHVASLRQIFEPR